MFPILLLELVFLFEFIRECTMRESVTSYPVQGVVVVVVYYD